MKEFDDPPSADEDPPSNSHPVEVSRRNLLAGTAAAVAVTGLADAATKHGKKHPGAHAGMHPGAHHPGGGMGGMDSGQLVHSFPPNPKTWHQPFLEPPVLRSDRTGTLAQQLNVGFSDISITTFDKNGAPTTRSQCVRCYNGSTPGPTFRVMPGDTLQFTLNNLLPPNRPAPAPGQSYNCMELMDNNFPGCFNTTNLHTHGLHVSPKSTPTVSSDDVTIRVVPNNDPMSPCNASDNCYVATRNYCIQLPTFHAPGTHWYHAHVHGATGIQVSNGLAGALIVEEPADQKIPADSEVIWMVQEVIGGANAPSACNNPDTDQIYMSGSTVYSNMKALATDGTKPYGKGQPQGVGFTVNSLSAPTLKMLPNEIQRWRFIDGTATPRGIFNISLLQPVMQNGVITGYADFSNYMYLIAVDGITFYGHKPQALPKISGQYPANLSTNNSTTPAGWELSPGNRADVLVSLPAGTYQVWRLDNGNSGGTAVFNQILAIIEVAGSPMPQRNVADIPLPGWDKAPCYLQPIMDGEINADPLIYNFQVKNSQGGSYFGGYTINNQVYGNADGSHPNTNVTMGDVRKTTLLNSGGGNHPFHIHVNPFQVEGDLIDPNLPNDPWNWRWWDTILLPEPNPVQECALGGNGLPQGYPIQNLPTGTCNYTTVNTRSRYLTYDGTYVLHCHVLIHEDAGMMQDFTVNADPANGYPSVEPCQKVTVCQKGRPPAPK